MRRYSYTTMLAASLCLALAAWGILSIVKNSTKEPWTVSVADAAISGEIGSGQKTLAGMCGDIQGKKWKKKKKATRAYFDDALFIGDSRTVGLSEYGNLGKADVFADSGMSVYKIFDTKIQVHSGKKTDLESLLKKKNYGKIYIMLGINEMGYSYDKTMDKYEDLVNKVHKMQPDALMYLEANLHVTKKKSKANRIYSNKKIDRMNQAIKKLANDTDIFYIDVNERFDDGKGNLDKKYTADDSHPLGKYYADWVDWILSEAVEDGV